MKILVSIEQSFNDCFFLSLFQYMYVTWKLLTNIRNMYIIHVTLQVWGERMYKEFLDLTRQNADDEEVENAIKFEDEWADINEESWSYVYK